MASLQVLKFAGAYSGTDLSIPDGPPTDSKLIATGSNGTVFGPDNAPAINVLTAIGGDVIVTWPNGVTETIQQGQVFARALRGETIGVA